MILNSYSTSVDVPRSKDTVMGLFESKKAREDRIATETCYRDGFQTGVYNFRDNTNGYPLGGGTMRDNIPPPEGSISVSYIRKWKTDTSFTYEVRLCVEERVGTRDVGCVHDIEAYARGLRDGYAKYRTDKLAKIATEERGNAKNAGEDWNTV